MLHFSHWTHYSHGVAAQGSRDVDSDFSIYALVPIPSIAAATEMAIVFETFETASSFSQVM